MREVNSRRRFIDQSVVPDVADDADDLRRRWVIKHNYIEPLSERILVWEIFACQCLVDQDDALRLCLFGFGEVATAQQRNSHRAEVTSIDDAHVGCRLFSGWWFGLAQDLEAGTRSHASVQRQEVDQAGGAAWRQLPHALECLVEEVDYLRIFAITIRKPDHHGQNTVCIKAAVGVL